jgi:hypothetical protein
MTMIRSVDHHLVCRWPHGVARGTRYAPSGVTLLEVLFSMGIVTVGLLGVMIIVPLAGSRSAQGTIADGADRMGRNAIRLFDVHHIRQPNMWTRFNTTVQQYQEYGVQYTGTDRYTYLWRRNTNATTRVQARSFCIDPVFVAQQVADATSASTNVLPETQYFPYYQPGVTLAANVDARMDRVSLRTMPGGATGMTVEQALSIFMADDDVSFNLPADRTLPPQQKFDASTLKRQFEGKFSWLATVTPVYTSFQDSVDILPDTYVLSIVVFHRRDMSMTMAAGTTASDGPGNERLVSVSQFHSEGYAGGEVELQTRPNQPATDLAVKEGEWVMLLATVNAAPASGTPNFVPVFRWYRVMAADDIVGNGPFTRNVTLQGLDWNDVYGLGTLGQASPTQATLLNGVVAVYEKTIRLETSSMWTN